MPLLVFMFGRADYPERNRIPSRNTSMPASAVLIALTLATWPADSAGDGMAMISKGFTVAEQAMAKVEEGTMKPGRAAVMLGGLLGESRLRAGQVSAALLDTRGKGNGIRLVAWSGTYEAYLSSAVMGLDGDESSLALSRILGARLRREITRGSR